MFLQQGAQHPAHGALVPHFHGEAQTAVVEGGYREPGHLGGVQRVGDQVVVEPAGEVDGEPGVHVGDPAVRRGGTALGLSEARAADASQGPAVQAGFSAAQGPREAALHLAPHAGGHGGGGGGADGLGTNLR